MIEDRLFYRPIEDKELLVKNRKDSFKKGWPTGFKCLDEITSFLPKYQTLVFAPPHVGKSVIMIDILMAQAEMGRNVCIYSPEFRDRKELINALIQARMSVCFFGSKANSITDDSFIEALDFVNKHFVIIVKPRRKKDDSQSKMSIKKIFNEVKKASDHFKMKFDFLFIDPINYTEKDGNEKFMETQDYVLNMYDQIAEYSEVLNLHSIISAHTRDVELVTDKESGKQFYPVLHPSTVMGGQSNFRCAYNILHLHRCPEGVLDKNGIPYPANYTKIFCQKAKPFGIGRLGNTGELVGMDGLFFDPDTYTMYEIVQGRRYYRNEYYAANGGVLEEQAAIPNIDEEESLF